MYNRMKFKLVPLSLPQDGVIAARLVEDQLSPLNRAVVQDMSWVVDRIGGICMLFDGRRQGEIDYDTIPQLNLTVTSQF
jgi:hypothetical protein